jgi:hypothetical protein
MSWCSSWRWRRGGRGADRAVVGGLPAGAVVLLGRLHGADRGWEAGNGKSLKSLMCVGGVNETLDGREGETGEVIR